MVFKYHKLLKLLAIATFCINVAACDQGTPIPAEDEDPGVSDIPCATVADCPDPDLYQCIGVCKLQCTENTDCAADAYCTDSGFCEVGCRNPATCPEGQYCVNGSCQAANSECTSKCDCGEGWFAKTAYVRTCPANARTAATAREAQATTVRPTCATDSPTSASNNRQNPVRAMPIARAEVGVKAAAVATARGNAFLWGIARPKRKRRIAPRVRSATIP